MKNFLSVSALTCALFAIFSAEPAIAQRAEKVTQAYVFERDQCLLTPESKLAAERASTAEFFGPLLATVVAGFAGELAKAGVNAVGDALDTASREQGFAGESSAAIRFGMINPGSKTSELAAFKPTERCLIFYVPSKSGIVDDMLDNPTLTRNGNAEFDWLTDEAKKAAIVNELGKEGLQTSPLVYAEAIIMPGKEAFIFRPTLVWYGSALPGAPRNQTAAELHVLFATPGFDAKTPGIGTGFASARLPLPKLAPGTALHWDQLKTSRSVWLPMRPTSGAVDATVQGLNTAKALVVTKKVELEKAENAFVAAERLAQRKPSPEASEAVLVARESRDAANRAFTAAQSAVNGKEAVPAGATNVQLRFVVIRDANKFGQALAKALKGQAETVGKGVAEGLSPMPDWAATDTGYLSAMIEVEKAQKAYDDAISANDATAITSKGYALKLAQAKANEAAVASKKSIPFPGLLLDP